jgi:hypothetical protein
MIGVVRRLSRLPAYECRDALPETAVGAACFTVEPDAPAVRAVVPLPALLGDLAGEVGFRVTKSLNGPVHRRCHDRPRFLAAPRGLQPLCPWADSGVLPSPGGAKAMPGPGAPAQPLRSVAVRPDRRPPTF